MAGLGTRARDQPAMLAVAGLGILLLSVLATRADSRAIGSRPGLTMLDLAVGLTFVLAALLAIGSPSERLLVGAVGLTWLAGSVFASARSLHQGVLAVALLAFPAGRLTGLPRQFLAGGAILVALEIVPQLGVAVLFASVAVSTRATVATPRRGMVYPAAAATAVAASLLFAWWALQGSTVTLPTVVYETILLAVALGFPLVTHTAAWSKVALADRVLGDPRFAGLTGLRLVLAGVLDDPDLTIELWDAQANACVDSGIRARSGGRAPDKLSVFERGRPLARVATTSSAVADGPTAAAVVDAVRLAVANHRLREQHVRQIADLEASRARLQAAADSERERVASRLLTGPGASLQKARRKLAAASSIGDPALRELIDSAMREVSAADGEVQRIVAGVPPTTLGEGGLRGAIEVLAARSPVPVTLNIANGIAVDQFTETALFYVCSEALTNASKHSCATEVAVRLSQQGDLVRLDVHDDGRGGADARGSGLQGLADRVAAAGGTFSLSSPTGGGTTVNAAIRKRS